MIKSPKELEMQMNHLNYLTNSCELKTALKNEVY